MPVGKVRENLTMDMSDGAFVAVDSDILVATNLTGMSERPQSFAAAVAFELAIYADFLELRHTNAPFAQYPTNTE